jgi:hypothetical protein
MSPKYPLSYNDKFLQYNGAVYGMANPTPYCTEYQRVYDYLTNKPNAAYAERQNNLVKTLVDASLWSGKFDLFYLFAQTNNDASEAQVNWINPGTFNCSNISDTAFTSLEGFKGDGVDDYLNTNYNPSTEATHYTLNAASFGLYLMTDEAAGNYVAMGATAGNDAILLRPRITNSAYIHMNSSTAKYDNTVEDTLGLFAVVRTGANDVAVYKDASLIMSYANYTSTAVPNDDMQILAYSGGLRSTYKVAMAFVGGSLTMNDVSILTNEVENYMNINGKGI